MNKKSTKMMMSMLVIVGFLLVFIVPTFAAGSSGGISKLMDIMLQPQLDDKDLTSDQLYEQTELANQIQQMEDNETNRFIIKYKADEHKDLVLITSGQEKDRASLKKNIKTVETNSKNISAETSELDEFVSSSMADKKDNKLSAQDITEQLRQILAEKQNKKVDPTVAAIQDLSQIKNGQIIILAEKQDPDKYIKVVKAKDTKGEIEYIQPDYEVEFSSVDSTVDEGTTDDGTIDDGVTDNGVTDDGVTDEITTDEQVPLEPVTDTDKVIVGVIDTGIDINHSDLQGKIWTNTGEIADNGIDDDSNGYIDDVNGWNFYDKNNQVHDENAGLEESHGTHIAGIIAGLSDADPDLEANQNNVEIMPLKVFSNGTAYTSDIIAAIDYAESMGVKIINCSWGCGSDNTALEEAMADSDILFVVAAGNSRLDLAETPVYPAVYNLDNQITVTSVNQDGGLSYFSDYSEDIVDIAALGRDIQSTLPNNQYGLLTGTSMSTAVVTAGAAAVLDNDNSLDTSEIKDRLLQGADKISPLSGYVRDAARLNVEEAISGNNQTEIQELDYEEDFDIKGFASLDEALQLFNSSPTVQVAAGYGQTLVLKQDGTVWAWGANNYGQCGIGIATYSNTLTQVTGLSNIVNISAGNSYNLAAKNDGTVWAWGYNNYGQLGNGTTSTSYTPVQVSGLTDVTQVAAGYGFGLALKSNGNVYAWGRNNYGQVGDGTTITRTTPVQVSNLTNISQVSAGGYHSLALKSDATTWAWGDNSYGQIGDGTTTTRKTPVQVSNLTNVSQVSAGYWSSLAVNNSGIAWGWGNNESGQLGNGSYNDRTTPTQVSNLSGVTQVSAGEFHSLALKSDGTVRSWGFNYDGELGNGTTTIDSTTPVQVSNLTGCIQVSAGMEHSLALKNDDTVCAWGINNRGQTGDGSIICYSIPKQVSGITNITKVVAGRWHGLALNQDGTVWAWGYNLSGELGNGTTTDSSTPIQVSSLSGITQVSAGERHSLALKSDGTVWAWGGSSTTPVQVSDLAGCIQVSAGQYHSIALKSDGTVWAWGDNSYGQLGDGTTTTRTTPVQVSGLTGVIQIAAGYNHNLALKSDGTVWAWGDNNYGQLGDGSTTTRTTPVQISSFTNVTQVAAGMDYSLALKGNGTVWAWGYNNYGQLGDGSTTTRTTPVQVTNLYNIIQIAAGESHSLAIMNDNTVWSWGDNGYGQLGDDTITQRTTPAQISGLTNITQVAAGQSSSLILKSNNTVCSFGDNYHGKLGFFYKYHYTTPIQSWTEEDDYPDSQAQAAAVTISNQVDVMSGSIQVKQDVDWLAIKADSALAVNIAEQAATNVYIGIYDDQGQAVTLGTNNTLNMAAGEVYYFKVYYDSAASFTVSSYSITVTPSSLTFQYTYDNANRIQYLDVGGIRYEFVYDDNGNLLGITTN